MADGPGHPINKTRFRGHGVSEMETVEAQWAPRQAATHLAKNPAAFGIFP
jgi:hypothetical protein